jgi:Rps23 Pro-64 3,4-dihydroxylase Tpa1-like proline 4-hydroxylase
MDFDHSPWPHVVIDGFWPDADALREAAAAIRTIPHRHWRTDDHAGQRRKRWIQAPRHLPHPADEILRAMNGPAVLDRLVTLTGLQLLPDPEYVGGGVHEVLPGGLLDVHADFNLHPRTGLHRRVNLLLYLNEGWHDEWGGHLELWERDMSRCGKRIAPVFNRGVLLLIDDTAFHGHPQPLACPEGISRLAFATYFYTADRPDHEKAAFHWASWQGVAR